MRSTEKTTFRKFYCAFFLQRDIKFGEYTVPNSCSQLFVAPDRNCEHIPLEESLIIAS